MNIPEADPRPADLPLYAPYPIIFNSQFSIFKKINGWRLSL